MIPGHFNDDCLLAVGVTLSLIEVLIRQLLFFFLFFGLFCFGPLLVWGLLRSTRVSLIFALLLLLLLLWGLSGSCLVLVP